MLRFCIFFFGMSDFKDYILIEEEKEYNEELTEKFELEYY